MTSNDALKTKVLDECGNQISHLVESFIELGVLVHDFKGEETSLESLAHKLNKTVEQLDRLAKIDSEQLSKIPIPKGVLEYIEAGRNPNVYTREFVESTRKSNQSLRGKMIAFKQLRDSLGDKIGEEFPELKDDIAKIYEMTNDAQYDLIFDESLKKRREENSVGNNNNPNTVESLNTPVSNVPGS